MPAISGSPLCTSNASALEADSSWSGGSIWNSSELLAHILIEKPPQFWTAHPRVLELGSGCGLVGITAAAMGARYVAITDQIIHMAQYNVDLNYLPGTADRNRIDVRTLRWGSTEDMSDVLSLHSGSWHTEEDLSKPGGESENGSGRGSVPAIPYNLILGSDCIYNREYHGSLATTIDLMAGVGATVLW